MSDFKARFWFWSCNSTIMNRTDFSMLLRKCLSWHYVEKNTYILGKKKKKKSESSKYVFCSQFFLGFVSCLLLLPLEEKTKMTKHSHSFQSWKLKFSKHFGLRHNVYYEINYCIIVGQSSFPSSILILKLAEYQLRGF